MKFNTRLPSVCLTC